MWRQKIEEAALQCGFPFFALADAQQLKQYCPNEESIRQGITGNPDEVMEGAQSILILGMPVNWTWEEKYGYACLSPFYPVSNQAYQSARKVEKTLLEMGIEAKFTTSLAVKPYAAQAFESQIGMNTLLLHPQCGSRIAIQSLLLKNHDFKKKPTVGLNSCSGCGACISACPTGALEKNAFHPESCLRTWMLSGRVMPPALRKANGWSLLGCDACQKCCPQNVPDLQVRPIPECLNVSRLLQATPETLSELAQLIGRNEARKERVLAQACLIAGNLGDRRFLPRLEELSQHPRDAIRVHAAWAIEQIRG